LGEKRVSPGRWISVAAMITIIIGISVILLKQGNNRVFLDNAEKYETDLAISNPNLKETEVYYTNMVNNLYRKASPLLTANPELERELNTDITQIDSICFEIRKDLKDNIANQEVIEALIQNYREKIELLEEMLNLLNDANNESEKNRSHEL
jgi:LPS O-antigen subunit length determinant protein (WzzB/FepE family)